ncbi:unnamed protein product [Linum trigynum]|uniref:Uncharacterized protein n=1 Tax=Linum trigynum TaxID=586398 RepID=A0AAV2GP02_9ROSI
MSCCLGEMKRNHLYMEIKARIEMSHQRRCDRRWRSSRNTCQSRKRQKMDLRVVDHQWESEWTTREASKNPNLVVWKALK